jgi:hypothetical protein
VAETLSRQTGGQIRHVRVPPDAVGHALEQTGVESWFAEDMAKLHRMLAGGYEDVVTDDAGTATGSRPRTLSRFARDHSIVFTGPRSACRRSPSRMLEARAGRAASSQGRP